MAQRKMMGEILTELGVITEEELKNALEEQKRSEVKLGKILIDKGILTEQQILETLEFMLGIPQIQLSKLNIEPEIIKILSPQLIRLHKVLPISRKKNTLTLAMADPLNQQAIDDVRMASGLDVIPVLASARDMDVAIRQYLAFRLDPNMERILGELNQESKNSSWGRRDLQAVKIDDDAPIIRMVNSILIQAVQGRASDIHVEPQEDELRIRFRVDGELYEVLRVSGKIQAAVVSRIKIMAGMDIAEKRVPQDGRFHSKIDYREVDFRVSTLPTVNGEKVVMRILDQENALSRIDHLGLSNRNKERFFTLSRIPQGMILVTGPTGSGKTTTLYSILNEVNSGDKNIITLEDPIEYTLPGINQVQINLKAGLTFAGGLRAILRQDPDIIMVGEIRDHETAQLAVQAALTGHMVLSTLHTNSAAGTIARLKDMGIEDFLLASALAGVISQRLTRQLCRNCSQEYILDPDTANNLGIPEESGNIFYRPGGCSMCRQLGYQGRVALHEIMMSGPELRTAINQGESSEDYIEEISMQEGMSTIKMDGINKAKQGITSLEEVMKVVLLGG